MANLISCVSSLYDHWKMRHRDLIYGHMKIHKTAEDHGLFGPVFSVLRPKRPSVLRPSDHLYLSVVRRKHAMRDCRQPVKKRKSKFKVTQITQLYMSGSWNLRRMNHEIGG